MSLIERPQLFRWDNAEWERAVAAGIFDGNRVELIGGEIINMSPQLVPHARGICRTAAAMRKGFPESNYWVRDHLPLHLGDHSEPDAAVTQGAESNYTDIHHPATTLVIIEVSQSTLAYDRDEKASLYASAGIADYWIVNLGDRQVEVHRKPVKDARQRFGRHYSKVTVMKPGDSIAPLATKNTLVPVADLLP